MAEPPEILYWHETNGVDECPGIGAVYDFLGRMSKGTMFDASARAALVWAIDELNKYPLLPQQGEFGLVCTGESCYWVEFRIDSHSMYCCIESDSVLWSYRQEEERYHEDDAGLGEYTRLYEVGPSDFDNIDLEARGLPIEGRDVVLSWERPKPEQSPETNSGSVDPPAS